VGKRPNFFIVGAPKCGTTALYRYLRPHPNIFMAKVKEPHFFAQDLGTYPSIKTLEEYERLFADSTEAHLRIGEASVYYLRSSVAIPNIQAYNPAARIIAMFRNPIEMVHSLHSQLLYWAEENEPDFATAWGLQERRARSLDLPPRSGGSFLLQYHEVGRLGSQAKRLLEVFPREQVKLILYDDFATSPRRIYDEVIAFLEVPHDGRTQFPRVNENKRVRVSWLKNFIRKPPPMLRRAYRRIKTTVGPSSMDAMKARVVHRNTVQERRRPLSPEMRAKLVTAFRGEVALLSQILERDLTDWLA
jgi:hypothetical protein